MLIIETPLYLSYVVAFHSRRCQGQGSIQYFPLHPLMHANYGTMRRLFRAHVFALCMAVI